MRTGGVARRATLIEQARAETEYVLLVDAGDAFWSDRPFTVNSEYRLAVQMFNALNYDAVGLGGQDLQLGADLLRQRLDEATFPVLSANVVLSETGELLAVPYTIRDIGGHRVAILGLADRPAQATPGLRVVDSQEAARQYLPGLAAAADVLILLSHAGPEIDAWLEAEFPLIDLIVAGGYNGAVDRPFLADGRPPVLLAERPSPGHAGRYVGRAALTFDSAGGLTGLAWRAVPLDPEWADDPRLLALVAEYANRPAIAPLTGQ